MSDYNVLAGHVESELLEAIDHIVENVKEQA